MMPEAAAAGGGGFPDRGRGVLRMPAEPHGAKVSCTGRVNGHRDAIRAGLAGAVGTPHRAGAADARDHQALPGRPRERPRRLRGGRRARCTRCSARTAPARRRSRTSSPASTGPTRARSCSTASRSRSRSPRQAIDAGRLHGPPAVPARRALHRRREHHPRRPARRRAQAARRPERRRGQVRELGERYGLPVDPHARIWQLSVGEQQRVEILKALYQDARDPDPRRADRGAHARGGRHALRHAPPDGRRGPDGHLHLAQAARGDGGLRPRHRAPRRPPDRHRPDRRSDAPSRSPR